MAKKTTKKASGKKASKSKVDPKLIEAAEDMNEVMGLDEDDVIDVSGTEAAIKKGLKNAAGMIEEGDEFEETTYEVLEELGYYTRDEEEEDDEEEEEGAEESEEDDEEEEEEDDEEEEEEDDEEEEEPAPKKKSKKAPPAKKSKKSDEEEDDEDDEDDEEEKPKKKSKGPKGASPYGTALDILCKKPDMTKDALNKALAKKGIEAGAGTNTAYSSVRAIVKRLREHGHME